MKLPSIQSLLNPPSSPPHHTQRTPSLKVLPPSPMETNTLSPVLSPALSSTRSPSISSIEPPSPTLLNLSEMNLSELPPIHGDDPPRRLIHSPKSSPSSPISPNTTTSTTHFLQKPNKWSDYHLNNKEDDYHSTTYYTNPSIPSYHHHRSYSSSSISSSSSNQSNSSPQLLSPPSLSPPKIIISPSTSSSSLSTNKKLNQKINNEIKEEVPAPPPCTQILISPTGQPILKRRRGRPPTRSPGYDEGGWTFLSPTVWDVNNNSNHQQQQQQQNNKMEEDHEMMDDSMAAFTSSNMDTVLPMPKKKRGRKPKTYIEGNSCFVWKDISSRRTSSSKLTTMEL